MFLHVGIPNEEATTKCDTAEIDTVLLSICALLFAGVTLFINSSLCEKAVRKGIQTTILMMLHVSFHLEKGQSSPYKHGKLTLSANTHTHKAIKTR